MYDFENIQFGIDSLFIRLLPKILLTIGILIAISFIRLMAIRLISKYMNEPHAKFVWKKWVTSIIYVIGIFLIISVWIKEFQSIFTFLGLLTAGIAIALRDPVANFFGWLFILWRKPFKLGDRIRVGEFSGDVIDINTFQFKLMEIGAWIDADQHTGRIIEIPNNKVFNNMQVVYSGGFPYVWNEIHIPISFESNWVKAREILNEIAVRKAPLFDDIAMSELEDTLKEYTITNYTIRPRLFVRIIENGIRYSIRYLCRYNNKRGSEQEFWDEILTRFANEKDIMFAYPTQRFYNNAIEGKEEAKKIEPNSNKPDTK